MSDLIAELATNMVERKRYGSEPYVFLLGAGASISSDCPTFLGLAEAFLQRRPEKLAELQAIVDADERAQAIMDAFFEAWETTVAENRRNFLRERFEKAHAEAYDHIAWLMVNGYARVVLSTNLDNLTENALKGSRLVRDTDYEVITNGRGLGQRVAQRLRDDHPPRKIVKLHGTLAEPDSYAILPEECYEFEDEVAGVLRDLLGQDVVIIGSRLDDRDLDLQFEADGGEVWFVNPRAPSRTDRTAHTLRVRRGKCVSGDDGLADVFLQKLRTRIEAAEGQREVAEEPRINQFLRKLGYSEEIKRRQSPLLHLPELYVKPREYEAIRETLDDVGCVIICGEPHMGKTYTALHVLWEHFEDDWEPVHMPRPRLADELRTCNYQVEEFIARWFRPGHIIHLDDPLGEIEYEPVGGIEKSLARLLAEARLRENVKLVLTSRLTVLTNVRGQVEGLDLRDPAGPRRDVRVEASYDPAVLGDLVERYGRLYEMPWAEDAAVVARLRDEVPAILPAPHNIELFARTSGGYRDTDELIEFARTCQNLVAALADWVARVDLEQRLFLFCVAWLPGAWGTSKVPADGPQEAFRGLLAHAYAQGIVLPSAFDPWQHHLSACAPILRNADGDSKDVRFYHPSYPEAIARALQQSEEVRDTQAFFLDWCLARPEQWLRMACLAPTVEGLANGLVGLPERAARLAADPVAEVRERLAYALGWKYANLDAEGRGLVARLAEDEGARGSLCEPLAWNYANLDAEGRALVERIAAEGEGARRSLALGLGGNYANLGAEGRELVERIAAEDEGARGSLALGLGGNYANLDAAGRELAARVAEYEAARGPLAHTLGSNYQNLDAAGRALLGRIAAEDEGARGNLAYALGRNYANLDAAGRELLEGIAVEDEGARGSLARGLGGNYVNLDAEGRELARRLADDEGAWRGLLDGLRRKRTWLDDPGHALLAELEAREAEEPDDDTPS